MVGKHEREIVQLDNYLSNLNHFQFAYMLDSFSNGRSVVGAGSGLVKPSTAGSLCLYFFAMILASENTF